jgi:hypothetical protein
MKRFILSLAAILALTLPSFAATRGVAVIGPRGGAIVAGNLAFRAGHVNAGNLAFRSSFYGSAFRTYGSAFVQPIYSQPIYAAPFVQTYAAQAFAAPVYAAPVRSGRPRRAARSSSGMHSGSVHSAPGGLLSASRVLGVHAAVRGLQCLFARLHAANLYGAPSPPSPAPNSDPNADADCWHPRRGTHPVSGAAKRLRRLVRGQ